MNTGRYHQDEVFLDPYEDLLHCALCMLKLARAGDWQALSVEEIRFVEFSEQVARGQGFEVLGPEQREIMNEVKALVDETRLLLLSRRAELDALLPRENARDECSSKAIRPTGETSVNMAFH